MIPGRDAHGHRALGKMPRSSTGSFARPQSGTSIVDALAAFPYDLTTGKMPCPDSFRVAARPGTSSETPDMKFFRICRPALSVAALLCALASAEEASLFTSPLPTGVRLDPAGEAVDLGSLPINLVLAPEKERAVVVLSGWREQGVQVVDLKMRKVPQTLLQDGAFYGASFSPDGHRLCVSGGNTDVLFVYTWKDGAAALESKFELARAKTQDGMATSYPAGLVFSPNGKFIYVAEDVGDRLAVVNAATGEITQRFSTDHYPYAVALTADGQVFVSAWGGSTVSQFRVLADGT